MRRFQVLLAATSIGLSAAQSQAKFTFTLTDTPLAGAAANLQRVNLYALSDNGGDLFAADLVVWCDVPNGITFSVVDTDGDSTLDTLADKYTSSLTPATTSTTRVNGIVFGYAVGGFPHPDPNVSLQPYLNGLTTVEYVGFDGRDNRFYDVGVKAGLDQNGGRGAAVASVVTPLGAEVRFSGQVGDDSPYSPVYPLFADTNLPEPAAAGAIALASAVLARRRANR